MKNKPLPPLKPPAPKAAPLNAEQVAALARLQDPNYGKPQAAPGDAQTPPSAGEGTGTTNPPVDGEKTPPAPAETPAEAQPDPAAHTHRRASDPAPAPAEPKKPWEDLSDQPRGLNFQPDASLHAKMNWVCNNVPKMSRLRILREGAMAFCDALIEKHYKEEP